MDKGPGWRILVELLAIVIIWLLVTRGDDVILKGKLFLDRIEYLFGQ